VENATDLRVHDQVEVTLAISDFDIGQAVPLLRQRPDRFGKEAQTVLLHIDGQFACFCLENPAGDPDDIADVHFLEKREGLFPRLVFTEEGLKRPLAILYADEGALAEIPNGHQPTSKCEALRHLFQRFVVKRTKPFADCRVVPPTRISLG